eukprot:gene4477-4905_t
MINESGIGIVEKNPMNSRILTEDAFVESSLTNQEKEFKSKTTDNDDHTTTGYYRTSISVEERESTFVRDLASDYDFCIVLPNVNGELVPKRGKDYVRKLQALGFEIFLYRNLDADNETIVLIRTPLPKLRAFADLLDFRMLLDPQEVTRQLAAGDPEKQIAGVTIAHNPEVTPIYPNQYIYGKYSRKINEELYWREEGYEHPFREIIRLKLSALLLEHRSPRLGENLKIRRYLRSGWIKACFPLHNGTQIEMLTLKWKQFPIQRLPLEDLKEYFGEKIALYFVFMEHYTSFLAIPAVVGIPLQIAVFAMNDYSAPFLPFFSFFVALWAITMLEFWKRREKRTALKWGMIDFETDEVDRADFRGETIPSFIDGSEIRYFSSKKRNILLFQSVLGVATLMLLVIGVVVSIYVIRYSIAADVGDSNAQTVASVANAVQIQVLNYIYSIIANALSERENHRTDTQFEDTMIAKIFWFQFVNSYASFFYLAFVAEWMGDCPTSGCMSSLTLNLGIIFLIRLVSGNALELLIPYLSYRFKYLKLMATHAGKISRPESEARLEKYDLLSSSLEDYAEVAIQYGYTALFVTALPMAAFCALISNLVEMKGDVWKLLHLHQRPFPKGGEDIGTWQSIFLMISVAAVITNAALTVFTMDTLDSFSFQLRMWIFVGFQWVCFSLQMIIMAVIPDVPEEIDIQLERRDFIVSKLIDKVEDEDDSDIMGVEEEIKLQTYPLIGGFCKGK